LTIDTDTAVAPAPPTLRAAHKELTRSRIRDAAKELFYQQGYNITTMDQIAMAAGVRRSTLYFHFKDKGEIVRRIAEDYAPKATAVMGSLPGPRPTKAQIDAWIDDCIEFVRMERAPTVLFREVTGSPAAMAADLHSLADKLIEAMAKPITAFRAALEPGEGQAVARARAELVMRELTRVCLFASRADATPQLGAMRAVARDLMFNFARGEANLLT
jgi:AcrR family transcriptional regulator